jgi:hypothetical protein
MAKDTAEFGFLTFWYLFKASRGGNRVQIMLDSVDLNKAFKEPRWQQNHLEWEMDVSGMGNDVPGATTEE